MAATSCPGVLALRALAASLTICGCDSLDDKSHQERGESSKDERAGSSFDSLHQKTPGHRDVDGVGSIGRTQLEHHVLDVRLDGGL